MCKTFRRGPILIERIYSLLALMPLPLMLAVAFTGHYFMESRMLRGIKNRVEAQASRLARRPAGPTFFLLLSGK